MTTRREDDAAAWAVVDETRRKLANRTARFVDFRIVLEAIVTLPDADAEPMLGEFRRRFAAVYGREWEARQAERSKAAP